MEFPSPELPAHEKQEQHAPSSSGGRSGRKLGVPADQDAAVHDSISAAIQEFQPDRKDEQQAEQPIESPNAGREGILDKIPKKALSTLKVLAFISRLARQETATLEPPSITPPPAITENMPAEKRDAQV